MENEKETKKNKVKKVVFDIVYWVAIGFALIFALCIGAHQSKTWDSMEKRLSAIEERLTNKEETPTREEKLNNKPAVYYAFYMPEGYYFIRTEALTLRANLSVTYVLSAVDSGNFFQSNNTTNTNSYYVYNWSKLQMGTSSYMTYLNAAGSRTNGTIWDSDGWQYGTTKRYFHLTGDCVFTMQNQSDLDLFKQFFYYSETDFPSKSVMTTGELTPQPESGNTRPDPETPDIESFNLNKRYDFRKWYGEVDPLTGAINTSLSQTTFIYDIGVVSVGDIQYDHLRISLLECNNAINIITGYDFQNQCYLAIGGADYYGGATGHYIVIGVALMSGDTLPATYSIELYEAPLVGARLQYESGNPISPTDYTSATGFLCSTFELKETAINWTNYTPSNTTYSLPGIGQNYTIYEVLQLDLLNDTYLDFYSVSASATGGNVFDLIGNAFKSLVPILGIQVIPGIPIGLLVVLPITATILVVVIKIVRK